MLETKTTKVSNENIPHLHFLVENHLKAVAQVNKNEALATRHRTSIVPRVVLASIVDELSKDVALLKKPARRRISFHMAAFLIKETVKINRRIMLKREKFEIKSSDEFKKRVGELEMLAVNLAPEIEGRSIQIKNLTVN